MRPLAQRLLKGGSFGLLAMLLLGASAKPLIPWEELTEVDWLYDLATRFSVVDSHRVHYKTPTAELATLLEARPEPEALRHLAQAQMDLGRRDQALSTIEAWAAAWAGAEAQNPGAGWDEAARWAWSYGAYDHAFRFAEQALAGLGGESQRSLADLRIQWAEEQPSMRDPRRMRREALELNATDWASAYTWVDNDISAQKLDEAEDGLSNLPSNTPAEPALVLRARLRVAQGRAAEVLPALEAALDTNPRRGRRLAAIYVQAIDQAAKSRPDEWRSILDARFDPTSLTRLFTYFRGQGRGDACLALLQQIDRRYQTSLDREGWVLVSSLYSEIDAVPEAFRARLAAATFSEAQADDADLAQLVRLALRASGRPLAWGNYSDADYRWIARMDTTPGFWTGGLSLLLTGQDWSEVLSRLEAESIPDRTFGAARALLAELIERHPAYPDIPALKLEVMRRHVDRGEGREALALLSDLEATGSDDLRQRAQKLGLLALRQTNGTLAEELRLYQAQLRFLAADGSQPSAENYGREPPRRFRIGDLPELDGEADDTVESGLRRYKPLLNEAISRLDGRDRTHRTALALILAELDRLPDAEGLWLDLARRLDGWNLDDELGPRYEAALGRFDDPSWWNRMARYLTRQKRLAEIRGLAERIAVTFRGSDLFARATDSNIRIEIPEQPRVGTRVRLVAWGDWVALKALERFPHSPTVLHAAERRLIRASAWQRRSAGITDPRQLAVVEDSFLAERRWAIFAADPGVRETYFADVMRDDALEAKLQDLETSTERNPVDDLVLAEGYARLSLFEKAADAASRRAAAYPGDESIARAALQIHRSLAGLDLSHEAPAKAVVDRAVPALPDPHPFITELGELYEETGRPEMALAVWKSLLDRDPRKEGRIKETAALLWDYGHMPEALDTIEAGRERLDRPRMLAFEAGVLREELKDVDGAIREYLNAVRPEGEADSCYCSGFQNDQRSLRRLAQWMGRERALRRVLGTIEALQPGNEADEKTLLAIWPLGGIITPTPGLNWDADDWIDRLDQPNDPVGREEREARRLAARGNEHAGIIRVAQSLVARATAMTPMATSGQFLSALQSSAGDFAASAWAEAEARDRFFTSIMARQAQLAPTEEERLRLEIALAQRLANASRVPEADVLWLSLANRIAALPESASKIQAEVARAAFVERTRGFEAGNAVWGSLIAKYPWSLGVIQDRIAFLLRNGRGEEARQTLEDATARAADGHLVPLLTRLVSESLVAKDLPRASRALDHLLRTSTLTSAERLGAVSLQARLRFQQDGAFNGVAFANQEAPKFKPELRAAVFAEVARAAAIEMLYPASVSAWIEALNRSTQRDWLREASRAARASGRPEVLVSFFEQQQQRSPRDVRWAVAARDLRVATDDLPGGIEMGRIAARVRPERQWLWDEAVELMERDLRFIEAGDFLEGWNVQRPADPAVAGKRSALYIRGHNLEKALLAEQAALSAFERTEPEVEDLAARRAEAARRLWRSGEPRLAWRLLSPEGDLSEIAATGLSIEEQFQLAVLNDSFLPLLVAGADSPDRVSAAASVLGQYGRLETREQVLIWLLEKLFPTERADDAFLNRWWPFIQDARLEQALRFQLAQRFARERNGPWSAEAPADFLDDIADLVVARVQRSDGQIELRLQAPDFDAHWAAHLVRFDRANELAAFLQPRFAALFARVRGAAVIDANSRREAWTAWLDRSPAMTTFARGLPSQPGLVQDLSDVFEDRRLWTRLRATAARGWDPSPLLAELRPLARVTWLSFRERLFVRASFATGAAAQTLEDPVLSVRRTTLNESSVSLTRFLSAASTPEGSGLSPFTQRLLGPLVLGDILGDDPKFTWPMFQPRTNVMGDVVETGDDRITGRGIDTLRFPGALWGERPGLAWYALQAYARYRAHDPSAIDVAAEWPEAGAETERALLTARLALALEGPAALARIEQLGLRTSDPELLQLRLKLLVDAGRTAEATAALRGRLIADQKTLNEDALRTFAVMAEDLGLPSPLSLLDPAVSILPSLLATIYDNHGVEVGGRFTTDDPVGFRAALRARWSAKAASLRVPELRAWLRELWANGAAPLPLSGLYRLGDFWPVAASWADTVPVQERGRAIEAIDALPDLERLAEMPDRVGDSGVRRLLMIRVRLARGEDDVAVALFRSALSATDDPAALTLRPIDVPLGPEAGAEDGREAGDVSYGRRDEEWTPPPSPSILVAQAIRAPFVSVNREALVQDDLVAWLDRRIDGDPSGLDSWGLRFEVGNTAERAAVGERLRAAWRRGDIPRYRQSEVVSLFIEKANELAAPWIQEAPPFWPSFLAVQKQANWLHDAGMNREAALFMVEARSKALFQRSEEVQAFDLWRRNIDLSGTGPDAWRAALPFWRDDPETIAEALQEHLKDHSLDALSARAALRRPTAVAPQLTFLAIRALRDVQDLGLIDLNNDETLLRLRAARSLLGEPRAAQTLGGRLAPEWVARELTRRRFRTADVNSALADLARLGAANQDDQTLGRALDLLADRKWEGAMDLRAELANALIDPPTVSHRLVDGRPFLYRPRDLAFDLVSQIVQSDLSKAAQDLQPDQPGGPQ